ncbi:MAG TPA: hypothetical protein VFO50_04845, partial [Candidatus Limnocylindrales bacterium]|nr:hypothetical protein [Candidatus Limnocylindrales bacterium]
SAGDAALPRFLAIQAAYETLVGPTADRPGARPGSGGAREPWRADPDRARAARGGATTGGRARPRPGTRPDGSDPSGSPGAGDARPGAEPRRPGRRSRPSNRATPGSTTYDAADEEPFEPEWSGGTWYGASSGTYWTINPKEYADPRKHGPEYQRRARRGADEAGAAGLDGAAGPGGAAGPAADGHSAASEPPPAFSFEGPGAAGPAEASAGPAAAGSVDPSPGPIEDIERTLLGERSGFAGRVAVALVGWPPIGIALSTIAGEVTGCSRFAAGCVDLFGVGTWLAQFAIIAILLALPTVATVSAVGTLAALAASVPTAVFLSATGGSREPVASAAALGFVLAVAYVAGVVFGIARRLRHRRVP